MSIQGRRGFLTGRRGQQPWVRPPWTAEPDRFTENCVRCGACVERCPEHIIVRGDGGFAEVDFARGACTFCGACADACPEPVFRRDRDTPPWSAKARIGESCLASAGVFCQSCADCCEPRAIRFAPRMGSVPNPVVSLDSCTGCGACVTACPAAAITVVGGR